jgi:hypothetical protein
MAKSDKVNAHLLGRLWRDDCGLQFEVEEWSVSCRELVLALPPGQQSIQSYLSESMLEDVYNNPDIFLPAQLEVCEEPILFEVLGQYQCESWQDYWGEWDGSSEFDIDQWTVAFEEDGPFELTKEEENLD